jgi:hypothetical protein
MNVRRTLERRDLLVSTAEVEKEVEVEGNRSRWTICYQNPGVYPSIMHCKYAMYTYAATKRFLSRIVYIHHSQLVARTLNPLHFSPTSFLSNSPLMHPSHTSLSYTPLIHPSHTPLSYIPLIHPSHTSLSHIPLIHPSQSPRVAPEGDATQISQEKIK